MATRNPTPSGKLTYRDYQRLPKDGKRHEIIDGQHFVTPAPNLSHQRILGDLYWHLKVFLRQQPVGHLYTSPFDVVMSESDVVQPDLVFIASREESGEEERSERVTDLEIRGVPDLVVEVLSSRSRKLDERVKFKRYEHFRVREYWIVEPELQAVKVHHHTGEGFVRVAELSVSQRDTLRTHLLPGFYLPLWQVFQS